MKYSDQLLNEVILTGWPADKKSLPAMLNPYYSYRDELSGFQGKTPSHPTSLALSDHETAAQLPHRNQWMSTKSP